VKLKSSEGNNHSKFAKFAHSHQRSLNFSVRKANTRTSNFANRRESRSDNILPAIIRQFSKRSPKLFHSMSPTVHSWPRASAGMVKGSLPILENTEADDKAKLDDPVACEEHESHTDFELPAASQTETETLSTSVNYATPLTSYASSSPCPCSQAIISRMSLLEITEGEKSKGTKTILVPNANFLDFCNAHIANNNGNAKRLNGESPCTRRRPPPLHAFSFIDSEQESTKVDGDEIMNEACIIGNPHTNDIQSPTTSARGEVVASSVVHTPPMVTFDMTIHEMNSSTIDGTAARLPSAVEDKRNERDEFPLLQSAIIAANLLPDSTSSEYFPTESRQEASSSSLALTAKDSGGSFSSTNTPSRKSHR
uniref:Uncharacterized protein n=1 Tax=Parascaris univalens TaxID=6257 RepID=A0A915A8I1_PARUN